jgi:hypothetical protein
LSAPDSGIGALVWTLPNVVRLDEENARRLEAGSVEREYRDLGGEGQQ